MSKTTNLLAMLAKDGPMTTRQMVAAGWSREFLRGTLMRLLDEGRLTSAAIPGAQGGAMIYTAAPPRVPQQKQRKIDVATIADRIPPEQKKGPGGAPRKGPGELRRWTLQELRDHCVITLTGCWEWRLAPGIAPRSEHSRRHVCVVHGGEMWTARRLGYFLMYGKLPAPGLRLSAAKCLNPRCQNPMHCTPLTESEKTLLAAAQGHLNTPHRRAAIAAGKRAASKVGMTMEKAQQIRATEGAAEQHCGQYGISKSMFNRIRKGRAWAEHP